MVDSVTRSSGTNRLAIGIFLGAGYQRDKIDTLGSIVVILHQSDLNLAESNCDWC